MAKDYYLILGVPLDAAPGEIRSAFRRLARRYHPDRRTDPSPAEFQRISEAYGVLSDPVRRARYDRSRRERRPLISEPVPLVDATAPVRPSFEALLERLSRNFLSSEAPKAEHEEPLHFELILSPEEAELGILIPFRVPVFAVCHHCGGLGCAVCDDEGRLVDEETVDVKIPAGVRHGSVFEISLAPLGIRNLWLRVYVRIDTPSASRPS